MIIMTEEYKATSQGTIIEGGGAAGPSPRKRRTKQARRPAATVAVLNSRSFVSRRMASAFETFGAKGPASTGRAGWLDVRRRDSQCAHYGRENRDEERDQDRGCNRGNCEQG